MDKNSDYSNWGYGYPPFIQYDGMDMNGNDNTFNPMYQYEQGYMYYRYMSQMMEYKIKCKEYERLYGNNNERKMN